MTTAQRKALATLGPQWVIGWNQPRNSTVFSHQEPLDLVQIFSREAPLVVEIGVGHGETLVEAARMYPDRNFLGFEVFDASIASCLSKIADHNLSHVRLIRGDGVTGLFHLVHNHLVEEIWVFFPDPWPKTRHHKRRLLSADFLDLVVKKLVPSGILRTATDWEPYADAIDHLIAQDSRFAVLGEDRFPTRPITKFESRALRAGRRIHDRSFQVGTP